MLTQNPASDKSSLPRLAFRGCKMCLTCSPLKQVLVNYLPPMNPIWPTACICKLSFIGTVPGLFIYILSVADFALQLQWSGCDRDRIACKAKNIYNLAFYKKRLPTPALGYIQEYMWQVD